MKREIEIGSIQVYDKNCIGCVNHKKDIMISYTDKEEENDYIVIDLFLTQQQALYLRDKLNEKIKYNKLK